MKRRTFIREVVLLSAAPMLWLPRKTAGASIPPARQAQFFQPPVASGGGACDTERDTYTPANNGSSLTNASDRRYLATKFTAAASYDCCAGSLYLAKSGSPVMDLSLMLYSHNSGTDLPDTLLATSSGTHNAASLTTGELEYKFTGLSSSIVSGTVYWLALYLASAASATDYIVAYRAGASGRIFYSSDGASWASISTARTGKFKLFSA